MRSRVAFGGLVVLVGSVVLMLAGCGAVPEPADLVVVGGSVVTLDPARPRAEAVAVRDRRLVAVGSEAEVRALVGPETRVLDVAGAVAYPGFVDAHGHLLGLGASLTQLDLAQPEDWDGLVAMVASAAAAAEPGQWILGRGWHQDKWTSSPPMVRGMPTREALDRVAPDNPVYLRHASGHAAIANGVALDLAGIAATTPDPAGGEIVRSADGEATGVLLETAMDPVVAVLPDDQSEAEIRRRATLGVEECLANGLTGFHDAGVTLAEVEVLRRMAEAGELGLRLWLMLGEPTADIADALATVKARGLGEDHLTVGGIKRYMDGALGSRGAWLLEPYADQPDRSGARIDSAEDLEAIAGLAAEHGYQLCVHAIGDRANREVLDLFERHGEAAGRLRWRVEHAQNLHPDDVPRFATLGVIAAMQPTHCVSDGPWVPDRVGSVRAEERAYVWRDLLDSGAVIASGTDTPVEKVSPIATFAAAVSRHMGDGRAFFPAQVMTREEALRSMTLDAAFAVFEEGDRGSLEPGKLADLTVLSQDILTVPEEEIMGTRVVHTIVGGEVRYSR